MNDFEITSALDPCSLFAYKIIERAVYDWRLLMQGAHIPTVDMDEIRHFLKGQWCAELLDGTAVSGEWVLKMLEDEMKRLGPMEPTERKGQKIKVVTVDGVTASISKFCRELGINGHAIYKMYERQGREYCEQYLTGVKRRRGL